MTNADVIRQMSDVKLAEFLFSIIRDWGEGTSHIVSLAFPETSYIDDWLVWLGQEVSDGSPIVDVVVKGNCASCGKPLSDEDGIFLCKKCTKEVSDNG